MRIHTDRHSGRFAALALALAIAFIGLRPASAAADAEETPAVWDLQEANFSYHGFTTLYQCESLESKVENVLRLLGAHESTRVRATGCELNRPSRTIFVRITAATPVPATPENLERSPGEESREELLERLGVKREFDPDEQFVAQWRTFALAREKSVRLEPGDCELMEHMRDRVFPKLGIEVVANDVRCSPGHVPLSTPRLDVRALVKSPTPDEPASE